jgi:FkbH-like protein
VDALLADPAWLVISVHASDRFGDNGLVGALFVRRGDAQLHIENFVMSCRVFSRGIEQACLAAILEHARATGVAAVYGRYRPTAKNSVVADLYPRYGFSGVGMGQDGVTATFRHDLREIVPCPDHVVVEGTFLEGAS